MSSVTSREATSAETLVERATRLLRADIISGQLAPSSRIHLVDAAGRLGMSPVPVREALRTLASQGLVVPVRNRGYRVSPVSEDDLDDTYRLRTILDPLAVELATPRLTEDHFRALEDTIEGLLRSYRADDWEQHEIHHRRFHFGIYGACGSRWLLRIIEMLWENSLRYQRLSTRGRGSYEQRAEEHAEILRACRARDAERAAELMRAHLSLTARTVHDLVEPKGPSLDGNRR